MARRIGFVVVLTALTVALRVLALEDRPKTMPPDIAGKWSGIWGPFTPAEGAGLAKDKCKTLDCAVTRQASVWQATFQGECGRPTSTPLQ